MKDLIVNEQFLRIKDDFVRGNHHKTVELKHYKILKTVHTTNNSIVYSIIPIITTLLFQFYWG